MVDWIQSTGSLGLGIVAFVGKRQSDFTSELRKMVRWWKLKRLLSHQGADVKETLRCFRIEGRESKLARAKCHVCILLISYLLISTDELSAWEKETDSEAETQTALQGREGITYKTPQALTSFRVNPVSTSQNFNPSLGIPEGDRFVGWPEPPLLSSKEPQL